MLPFIIRFSSNAIKKKHWKHCKKREYLLEVGKLKMFLCQEVTFEKKRLFKVNWKRQDIIIDMSQ